jgi:hypothetical protein
MRLTFTLFFLLLLSLTVDAQKITGIWRGYFTSTPLSREGLPEEKYKYEVQIEQLSNNSISGITYSYRSTVFYGKAELKGILTLPAKSLIVKETKLLELKIAGKSEPCLMTCYLDYTRIGKLEVLEGTFISVSVNDKKDCGSGKIYLEKVPTSDFEKEDFLAKKADSGKKPSSVPSTAATTTPITQRRNNPPGRSDNLSGKPATVKPLPGKTGPSTQQKNTNPVTKNNTPATNKPVGTKPGAGNTTAKNNPTVKNQTKKEPVVLSPGNPESEKTVETALTPRKEETTQSQRAIEPSSRRITVPKVLLERENNLVRTINVSETDIIVELYDNGTIDNDSISVYHNNEKVISTGRLSYAPLTVKIHSSREDARHELVIVAENLGDIPPNTAYMVIKSGRERFEITLASNEQRNAKVIINYVPKE